MYGPLSSKIFPIILLIVLIGLVALPVTYMQTPESWKHYSFKVTGIAIYDFDRDGEPEYLMLPYHVIDNYVVLNNPYPQMPYGLVLNTATGKELVLYDNTGDFRVFNGTKPVASYSLGSSKIAVSLDRNAIAVSNMVLYNNKLYTFDDVPPAAELPVYPVPAGRDLYILYTLGSLYLEDENHTRYTVYPDSLSVLGAFIGAMGKIYILARTLTGSTLYIEYQLNQTPIIVGYTVKLYKAITYTPDNKFIAAGPGGVYEVGPKALVLVEPGTYLGYDGSYVYTYYSGYIYAYNPITGTTMYKVKAPENKAPNIFCADWPYMALVYGNDVYVAVFKPEPIATLIVPFTATVGDKVYYELDTYGVTQYTLSVNGTILTEKQGYIVFNHTGTYVFTVSASNGVVTITRNYTITVLPRTLSISIYTPWTVRAYSKAPIEIQTYDGENGSRITLLCRITIHNTTLLTKSWKPVNITLIPDSIQTTAATILVTCGDNTYYKTTQYKTQIALQPAIAKPLISYLGNGTVSIRFTLNGIQVPGTVQVYMNGTYVGEGPTPYRLRVKPGVVSLQITFQPVIQTVSQATYTVTLHYYANLSQVPPALKSKVLIADRIITINHTIVKNQTIVKPVPVKVVKKVPVTDNRLVAIALIAGIGIGAAIGYIVRALLKNHNTAKEEHRHRKRPLIAFDKS